MSEYEEVMKVLFDRGLPSETCGKVAGVFNEVKDLQRQLEEVQKENTQLKEMREHLKWKDETRKEKERLERQLEEARESHRLAEEGVKFWITKYNELKEKGDE